MSRFDVMLIRVVAVVIGLWFSWQLAANTVIAILQQRNQISVLSQQLQACQAKVGRTE